MIDEKTDGEIMSAIVRVRRSIGILNNARSKGSSRKALLALLYDIQNELSKVESILNNTADEG